MEWRIKSYRELFVAHIISDNYPSCLCRSRRIIHWGWRPHNYSFKRLFPSGLDIKWFCYKAENFEAENSLNLVGQFAGNNPLLHYHWRKMTLSIYITTFVDRILITLWFNYDLWRTTWTDYCSYHTFYLWPLDKLTNKTLLEKNREKNECSAEDPSVACIWKNRKQKKLKNKHIATSIGTPLPSLMFCSVAGKSSINFKSWSTVVGDLSGHPVALYWSSILDSSQESAARRCNWDLKPPTLFWKTFIMSPSILPFISRLKEKCFKISNLHRHSPCYHCQDSS